ncbi:MAG: hypothetical protein IPG44_13010 [Anaerolineales bacterium]|nr:hypothetical protein [Anaerolineales bacterium]
MKLSSSAGPFLLEGTRSTQPARMGMKSPLSTAARPTPVFSKSQNHRRDRNMTDQLTAGVDAVTTPAVVLLNVRLSAKR